MDIKDVMRSLHPLERRILPHLKGSRLHSEILQKSKMLETEAMRALHWLAAKGALELKEDSLEFLALGGNGKKAVKAGLPESAFLRALLKGPLKKDGLKKAGLSEEEINACIGVLRGKAAISITSGPQFHITEEGRRILQKGLPEESLLKRIAGETIEVKSLKDLERSALNSLRKRKDFVIIVVKKDWQVLLTKTGEKLLGLDLKSDLLERLTPEILASGSWKGKEFRSFDINAVVPRKQHGKRHFLNQARASAKQVWLDMGFKEMTGPLVQTSFWNFDALFTAQDHPVRDLHDTFFIKTPKAGRLPGKKLVDKIKAVHETGAGTGSIGWRYEWSEAEAKKNVLRTHTTVLSARTLSGLNTNSLPAKYFALGKCFRNETLDWSHLFEFNQTEGIVVDENANFRHLLGYLKVFFKKMGYEKARFRPAYFPYTEFSVEIDVFHPAHKKWVELGGAGIFRPEVVKPLLGIDIPVLAWGPGFDRIITEYFGINDIRELYKNDLAHVRNVKDWMR
jgi:phenylalanyl-tRNA synthetase alpha chain